MSDYTIDRIDSVQGRPLHVPYYRVQGPMGRTYRVANYPDAAFLASLLNSATGEQIESALIAATMETEDAA